MRSLPSISPTAEQLAIISRNAPGTELIRGAAGSGKTTTALLKLRALIGVYVNRRRRQQRDEPVRILVLTFNRTLSGYIEALAESQASEGGEIHLTISTFGRWAWRAIGSPQLLGPEASDAKVRELGAKIALPRDFLVEEVDYLLGRFPPDGLAEYLTVRREGRGAQPRVDKALREAILRDVVEPYVRWKREQDLPDWNDIACRLQSHQIQPPYDVIIVDEAQDFSANQLRAIRQQLAKTHSLIFVVDTAQRIYARGFTWQEAGFQIRPENSHRLSRNYRNTVEIARFAASLIDGIPLDEDATMPDFAHCNRQGPMPVMLRGRFDPQVSHALAAINDGIDLETESVAFLHPLGWFQHLHRRLDQAGLPYVTITRESEWPRGPENIALSTLASAKGLEFDHVFMLGLNAEVLRHGEEEEEDERLVRLRRLIAMGIGRAKKTVTIGYKPDEASRLIDYFDEDTYEEIDL